VWGYGGGEPQGSYRMEGSVWMVATAGGTD